MSDDHYCVCGKMFEHSGICAEPDRFPGRLSRGWSKREDKYLSDADACLYAELSEREGEPFCEFRAVLCEHHGGHDACAVREMELVKALREVDAFAPHANECAIFDNTAGATGGFVINCDCYIFNVRVALELVGVKPRGTGKVDPLTQQG